MQARGFVGVMVVIVAGGMIATAVFYDVNALSVWAYYGNRLGSKQVWVHMR